MTSKKWTPITFIVECLLSFSKNSECLYSVACLCMYHVCAHILVLIWLSPLFWYFVFVCRLWFMMELFEKNLPLQRRHVNSSKVCLTDCCVSGHELKLFKIIYLTCPFNHILVTGYSQSHAATIGSVLVTNVKTGTRREGWDKSEVITNFFLMFHWEMSTKVVCSHRHQYWFKIMDIFWRTDLISEFWSLIQISYTVTWSDVMLASC